MSMNAFGIMLKPILGKYLEPLEENGTIAKLQRDIELIAKSNAIPELATLVSELQRHNALMERIEQVLLFAGVINDEQNERAANVEPRSDPGAAGLIASDRNGLSQIPKPD